MDAGYVLGFRGFQERPRDVDLRDAGPASHVRFHRGFRGDE